QKLLYYAQGLHLAMNGEPLFNESIEAWTHGPVVVSVYHEYKEYGSGPVPQPVNMDFGIFDEDATEFLDEVYEVYGQFSAWKLRNMTHAESPWRDTPKGGVISRKALGEFFADHLIDGQEG